MYEAHGLLAIIELLFLPRNAFVLPYIDADVIYLLVVRGVL